MNTADEQSAAAVPTARAVWHAVEPLHAVCYFHPGPTTRLKELGLSGWWMTYFAGRFGPAGAVGPDPAAAMAFGFAMPMVRRSLPDAWAYASPESVVAARIESSADALAETLPDVPAGHVEQLGSLLERAARNCRFDGRPLAAAWNSVANGTSGWQRVWVMATVLREHRGDGHVAAATAHGLTGLEAALTHVAAGGVTRENIQKNRGWTDAEWTASERALADRGIVAGGRLTDEGRALRNAVESTTDRLAAPPFDKTSAEADEIVRLAAPMARRIVDRGLLPVPNPIGAPRP